MTKGTFAVTDRGLASVGGLKVNGTHYPEPAPSTNRTRIVIDAKNGVTVSTRPAPAEPPAEKP